MANEATVNSGMQIKVGTGFYQSMPSSFRADVSTFKGPSPGAVTVATTGTNIDLSQLTQPGLCRIQNLSDTYRVEVGIHDGAIFHPLLELLPGESYVIRLSRNIGEEEDIPGTGTTADVNSLCLRSFGGSAVCLVEAFES